MTPQSPNLWPASAARHLMVISAILACSGAQAIVVNGGFESGDLSGWTISGDAGFIGVAPAIGRSGEFGAYFGPDPLGSIAQTLATGAGTSYQLRFWLALDDSATPNSFTWSWNGVAQGPGLTDVGAFDYVGFSAVVTASSNASVLQFNFANPSSFWRLDDVSAVAVVPEPAPWALLSAGMLALAMRRGRRASA